MILALSMLTEPANADFTFGTPTNIGPPVNSAVGENSSCTSANGLELYLVDYPTRRPGGHGDSDIWVATRATVSAPWGVPVNLGPTVNGPFCDAWPNVSSDGRALFFTSTRPGGSGSWDIWMTTRPATSNPWGTPVNLGSTVNSSDFEESPVISADGSTLTFSSKNRADGSGRLYRCSFGVRGLFQAVCRGRGKSKCY